MKKIRKILDKLSLGEKRRKEARILEKSMDKKSFTAKYSILSMIPGMLLAECCIIVTVICAFIEIGVLFYVLAGITLASLLLTAMEMTYRVRVNTESITESMFIFKKKIPLDSIERIEETTETLWGDEQARSLILIGEGEKRLLTLSDDAAGYEHLFNLVSKHVKTKERIAKAKK